MPLKVSLTRKIGSMTAPPAVSVTEPRAWPLGMLVALLAVAYFGYDLGSEPVFVDESVDIAQSYFFDLAVDGRLDDWAWVEYHAYDQPPLLKYLIGASLKVSGDRPPGRLAAGRWFANTKAALVTPRMLRAGRWPAVILGVAGCVAVFSIGTQLHCRWVGLGAAVLVMVDPLYRLHARRAMMDVPAEAFVLMALAVGLWVWRRALNDRLGRWTGVGVSLVVGLLAGLAVLTKLNGGLGLMVLGAWSVLALGLRWFPIRRRVKIAVSTLIAGVVSLVAFVVLNPFLYAHPTGSPPPRMLLPAPVDQSIFERLRLLIRHRAEVSKQAAQLFPNDALRTPREKLSAVAVQGFGRFGPFGPRDHSSVIPYPRYSWNRDASAAIWLPMVLLSAVWSAMNGLIAVRRGVPPMSWAVLTYFLVTLATVSAFIPLAWDRYYLPLQAPSALLVAGMIGAGFHAFGPRFPFRGSRS